MSATSDPVRAGAFLRRHGYDFARALLVLWAIGLAVAAVQLGSWRQELTRTLMQLNADAQFRARVQRREAVDPEWYRRKALSLLSATERMRQDTAWKLFVPGSWQVFDSLEEQLRERIAREFGEIVVETIRRELYARASQLTGVPQATGADDLQLDGECQSPVPQNLERKLTGAAEELPEFVAVADYVVQVEQLDAAVQAFLSLQYAAGQPQQLRKLVAYTLHTELPGDLARSAVLFHGPEEVSLQPALMQTRLQWATRCSLAKAMSALHTRLLNTNDLFALEQGLVARSTGLFDASARPASFDRTLERYRAVHGLLDDQQALLAKGRNDWMRSGTLQLGPAYRQMLQRIERTRLFGPEVVQQLEGQSGAAFAEFRRQFQAAFGSQGEPGIVWLDKEQRFGLSPDRAGLRTGLAALLKAPFMTEEGPQPASRLRTGSSLVLVSDEARALADARMRFLSDHLGTFPAYAQPVVTRMVDARVSELIYQKAYRTLKAALPADVQVPLDPVSFRQQRDQVLALQALLKETGGGGFGERLAATLDGELLRRLAVIQDDWRQQPLHDARSSDFGWWQGEGLSLAQTVGGAEAASVPGMISRMATRLDLLSQQAKAMIALGSPALAADPSTQRWLRIQSELERFQSRSGDSSLLRLERYLAALGPDLRRENCAERLAAQAPAAGHDDEIALRHLQIHTALAARCTELRVQAASVAAPSSAVPATAQ
jgi:type VI secretion system protein ImpL